MITKLNMSSDFALDVNSVGKLRLAAKTDSNASIKEVAKQFESLFVNMMLKSMRDATPKDGLFDSSSTNMYTGVLDQQMSQKLSSNGGGLGLADFMVKQLTRSQATPAVPSAQGLALKPPEAAGIALPPKHVAFSLSEIKNSPALHADVPKAHSARVNSPGAFVDKMWPHAAETAKELGIPAHFLIGHAALESGWGQREIRDATGKNSNNLFGIKAGRGWTGQVAEITTTEYVNGVPKKSVEKFRAYDSYEDSFRDYAALLRNNPRYAAVLEQGRDAIGFARGLQDAGYATDPLYANKIASIVNGKTMRQALTTA